MQLRIQRVPHRFPAPERYISTSAVRTVAREATALRGQTRASHRQARMPNTRVDGDAVSRQRGAYVKDIYWSGVT